MRYPKALKHSYFHLGRGGAWSARTPEWFAEVIVENGGTLQSMLNYSSGTTDWGPQIAELKTLSPAPDAVYISWAMPDIGILLRRMRAAGLDAWVVGSDGLTTRRLTPQLSVMRSGRRTVFR